MSNSGRRQQGWRRCAATEGDDEPEKATEALRSERLTEELEKQYTKRADRISNFDLKG